jgi:hypothetical protein
VDPETKRALDAIDRVCETPIETGPVELDASFLRDLERIEFLPQNQPRTDKTWVELSMEDWMSHYRAARRK